MKGKCRCTFIVPFKIGKENTSRFVFFQQAVESILAQSDPDWSAVFIDDGSNNPMVDKYISDVISQQKQQILYHKNEKNVGAGMARNIGIGLAVRELHSDVIMYQDSDDLSHFRRVEVISKAFAEEDVDVIYSPFIPIDEEGNEIPQEDWPYNIQQIMNNNKNPAVGREVWKTIVSRDMYINLTSATNLRSELAKRIPFPDMRSSEDSYTWMLYSASGGIFGFKKEIPTKYRIPQKDKNKSLSTEFGKENFYSDFANAHIEAYRQCLKYAIERKTITKDEIGVLTERVFRNLAEILRGDEMQELAEKIMADMEKFEL